jgi:hypothetical protein
MTKNFLPITIISALAIGAVPVASATAADGSHNRAEAAMTKGIRDFAEHAAGGAKASHIVVDAKAVDAVGEKATVTGTFRLTKDGRTATYRLTSKARALRLSPSAIEYRVAAKATRAAQGLPKSNAGFSGFFQGPAARESR